MYHPVAEKTKEPFLIYADRKAREACDNLYGPITLTNNALGWTHTYWTVMGGYGFFPYRPGHS